MVWQIIYSKQSVKDAKRLRQAKLWERADRLLQIMKNDPFQNPPPFEKLSKDLSGLYSRRINIQHRLVYQVLEKEKLVRIFRMWSHYE